MALPAAGEMFGFEGFRLDRRGLSRLDEHGAFAAVAIGSRALDVLGVLVERAGDLVARDEIVARVWPTTVVEDNNLNIQIAALRRILDRGRPDGSCIQTISSRGYRFTAPVTRVPVEARADAADSPPQPGAAPRLSIVVLPFANLSNDPDQQYFADALTEDLTTDLSRIGDLFVISRGTSFTYRDKVIDAEQIGRELGVHYVLEGSVRKLGARIRINAQLIDRETAAHLWAERFDRDTADLFAVQDEITSRIAVELKLQMMTVEAAKPTDHPTALDYYLRGRAAEMAPPSRDRHARVIGFFEQALALDPQSVAIRTGLAASLSGRAIDGLSDAPAADVARAQVLAEGALAASPRDPSAHYASAQVLRALGRWDDAAAEYETCIAYDRNLVRAYSHLGLCRLYAGIALDEIIPLMEQAIRLSPRDPEIGHRYRRVGQVHLLQSRIGEAIVWLERARSVMPAHPHTRSGLAAAYALAGAAERAADELAEARRLSAGDEFSSLARLRSGGAFPSAPGNWGVPKIRALFEATYFTGLHKAGVPEE